MLNPTSPLSRTELDQMFYAYKGSYEVPAYAQLALIILVFYSGFARDIS